MENSILINPVDAQYDPVVQELKDLLDNNDLLKNVLELSLKSAVSKASQNLHPQLFDAINSEFEGKGWPTTADTYLDYLNLYVRLVPNEEDDERYPNAWKSDGTKNGYNQKVYDLLCQFYWLVDQGALINQKSYTLQSFPEFAAWLVKFAKDWGSFLDTEASLTRKSLASFKADSMYNFSLYADSEPTWKTFNEFFYREFNQSDPDTGITPLRPIAAPGDSLTIVSPADCTFNQTFAIDEEGNVVDEEGEATRFRLKHTHTIGNINELLDGSEYASDFYGGTFVHYFLSPFDYHRFHTPVPGIVKEIKPVEGKVYLSVDLTSDGQWDAPDSANDGYEFTQARGLIIIDTQTEVGKVAVLPIGMCQVSGVDMYTEKLQPGSEVVKGQEFGKFKFGGSDIILLFQKAPDLYLYEEDPSHIAIHFQYGQTVAYWNERHEK